MVPVGEGIGLLSTRSFGMLIRKGAMNAEAVVPMLATWDIGTLPSSSIKDVN